MVPEVHVCHGVKYIIITWINCWPPIVYFYLNSEEVSQHLAGVSGVVELLLKHATNDKLSNDVKQNAAICLAKLATSDKRYGDIFSSGEGVEMTVFSSNGNCL